MRRSGSGRQEEADLAWGGADPAEDGAASGARTLFSAVLETRASVKAGDCRPAGRICHRFGRSPKMVTSTRCRGTAVAMGNLCSLYNGDNWLGFLLEELGLWFSEVE
jgi:hypothetical protein